MGSSIPQMCGVIQRCWKSPSRSAVLCSSKRWQGVRSCGFQDLSNAISENHHAELHQQCMWSLAMKPALRAHLYFLVSGCCPIRTCCIEQRQRCASFLPFCLFWKPAAEDASWGWAVYFQKFRFKILKNGLIFLCSSSGECVESCGKYIQTTLLLCTWDAYATEFASSTV